MNDEPLHDEPLHDEPLHDEPLRDEPLHDEPLHVVLVEDHPETRNGTRTTLDHDDRLRIVDVVGDLGRLERPGLQYDVCLLDLIGTGTPDQIARILATVPTVVYTADERWRRRVAAWTAGARSVLGKDVGGMMLVQAVVDAVRRPHHVQPQLAAALKDAVESCELATSEGLVEILDAVAGGRRLPAVLDALGIDEKTYADDLARLRRTCQDAGLGVLDPAEGPHENHADGHHGPPGRDPRAFPLPASAALLRGAGREVLELLADGYGVDEIAGRRNRTRDTVETQIRNALRVFHFDTKRMDVALLLALYMFGRHRRPELIRNRLLRLRETYRLIGAQGPPPEL